MVPSWIDQLEAQVQSTWNDVTSTGVPAIIAGAENYAAEQLQGMAQDNQAQATAATQNVMQSSGKPATGLTGSIQDMFSKIAQNAGAKQYAPYILVGAVALICYGMFVKE